MHRMGLLRLVRALPFREQPPLPESSALAALPQSIDDTLQLLKGAGYVADRALATVLFLSLKLGRPLFLEGEAGVGKTEIAKVLSAALGRRLIRLQCYEGLDVASAVYEWNYAGQMMAIRLGEAGGAVDRDRLGGDLFSERYLVSARCSRRWEAARAARPCSSSTSSTAPTRPSRPSCSRSLSDFPGSPCRVRHRRAVEPPVVIITSNRTREIHDALKRRCLYHWSITRTQAASFAILKAGAGRRPEALARDRWLRAGDPQGGSSSKSRAWRKPSTGPRRWSSSTLSPSTRRWCPTPSGVLLKYQDDIQKMQGSRAKAVLDSVRSELRAAE
jgi:hypothetical protein